MGDLERAWGSFAAFLTGQLETPYPKHRQQFPVVRERLELAVREVIAAGAEEAIVRQLADFLAQSHHRRAQGKANDCGSAAVRTVMVATPFKNSFEF
jgi:hypothetical protein